jgi:hypothetical protein
MRLFSSECAPSDDQALFTTLDAPESPHYELACVKPPSRGQSSRPDGSNVGCGATEFVMKMTIATGLKQIQIWDQRNAVNSLKSLRYSPKPLPIST